MEQYALKWLRETHLLLFAVILGAFVKLRKGFMILSFRRVLYVICFPLGNFPASQC